MNAIPSRQILNEAFKRFQRLPDLPAAATRSIQAICCVQDPKKTAGHAVQTPAANDETQFTKVLTG
jgi:hypothetical protein